MARSILEAAGPGIQRELDSKKKSSRYIHTGDLVVTQGYNLNASCVFHGVLKRWDNGQDDAKDVSNVSNAARTCKIK